MFPFSSGADRETPAWFDQTVPSIPLANPLMIHHITFYSPSLALSLSLSSTHAHTHTAYLYFLGLPLFPSFISELPIPNHFFFFFFGPSTSSFHFLFCLATFEVCHSSCFVGPYSLISTSAFVTLVQFHFQVVTVGRLEFGTVKVTMVLCEDA